LVQKTINLFLLGVILIAGGLGYHLYKQSVQIDEQKEFAVNYLANFKKDSATVVSTDFLQDPQLKKNIDDSQFNIEIYNVDTLVYWNNASITNKQDVLHKQFNKNGYTYKFAFHIGGQKRLHAAALEVLLMFLWFIGWLFVFLGHFQIIVQNRNSGPLSKSFIWHCVVALLLLIASYVSSHYFLGEFHLFKSYTYTFSNLHYTLWQYGWSFFSCLYILLLLSHSFKNLGVGWQNYSAVRYFVGAFLISGIIYYVVAVIELFAVHTNIDIKIMEPMNVGWPEFVLYLFSALFMFLVVFIGRQFFQKGLSTSLHGGIKTLIFSGAVLLVTMTFMLCGYHTNTVGLVLFLMIVFLLMDLYFEYFDINISFLLSCVVIFSLLLSTIIYSVVSNKNETTIKANLGALYKDFPTTKRQQLIALNDSIVKSELFPSLSSMRGIQNLDVKDILSYITQHVPVSKQFSIHNIYCYDKKGNSLVLNQISNKLNIESILSESEQFGNYVYYSPIERLAMLHYSIDNDPLNPMYLAILFKPLMRDNFILPYKHSIAVYKDARLTRTMGFNGANYPAVLPPNYIQDREKEVLANVVKSYTFVSVLPKKFLSIYLPMLTLFVTILGLLLILLILINTFVPFISDRHHLNFNTRKSLRGRFQATIVGLVLFSFILIGATTAYYYNKLYQIKSDQSFSTLFNIMLSEIQNELPEVDNIHTDERVGRLFKKVDALGTLPLALYDSEGILVRKSLDYDNADLRLVPSLLSASLVTPKGANYKVVSSPYDNGRIIIPIYNLIGKESAFIITENMSKADKYAGLYDFLSTLLTICVFLFLTALALSMIITIPMTKSLKNLAISLKNFKLGKVNKDIEWKNPDEIGSLIDNYNKMQVELNHSADMLSKAQRDMAWREMARQVAHEIKNPLTPMKLSIQHMQMALKNADADRMQTLIGKTSSTILEQIDNLTQIANEFSSFGTLPKATNDTMILNEVVEHIHDLFRKREDMDIQMLEPVYDLYVFADKNQLVRILNNIVKNATQSIPDDTRGKIEIELTQNDDNAIIKVSDNGVGIPDSMKEKVFTPNFTTKSSGTGLGLAICANMIDSMNGRIYFESPNDKGGTDFFIELPLVRVSPKDNDGGGEEVSLD
jgi:signal transduction histidine kinase